MLFGALLAQPAAAKSSAKVAIAAPKANQKVKGLLKIRPKVTAKKGPYRIRVTIGGKLVDQQNSGTRAEARSRIPIDTTELANGRHKLTVTIYASSKPKRARQTITIRVANVKPGPAGAGQRAPTKNLKNFKLLVSENFDLDAPTGSWVNNTNADDPVYTGSLGTPWTTYPSNFVDTFLRHPYRPAEVLSVHNNVLDFSLQPVDGKTAGANVSPVLPGGSRYQTYGRYSVRLRIGNADLSRYHIASLLWPELNEDYEFSESDFPENQLMRGRQVATGYSHYGKNSTQEYIFSDPIDFRDWHEFTQEWMPGKRKFYLDGKLIYTTQERVWSGPMRWQIQVQSYGKNGVQRGHLYIDWAAVWSWTPGTQAG